MELKKLRLLFSKVVTVKAIVLLPRQFPERRSIIRLGGKTLNREIYAKIETEEKLQAILTRITYWEGKLKIPYDKELNNLSDLVLEFEGNMELIRLIESKKRQPEIASDIKDI